MVVLFPFKTGETGLNGPATLDFLGLVIKNGVAVLDLAKAIDNSGIEKKHLGDGSLAATAVTDKCIGSLSFQVRHTSLHIVFSGCSYWFQGPSTLAISTALGF
jgi:hypothetical protein